MAASDYTIKVSYDSLETAIKNFNVCNQNFADAIRKMFNAVQSVDSSWDGSASEAYVNKFFGIYGNLMTSDGTMVQAIQGLQTALNVYRQGEAEALAAINNAQTVNNPFQG